MAITYGFFDAVYDSSSGTYDRTYTAEQMSLYFKGLVSDGVIASVGGQLQVVPSSGMKVQVKTGRMFIDSRWLQNDAVLTLTIPAAHATMPRKDAVVARLDYANRKISIVVKAGTAAASPKAPTITRNSTLFEIELAEIDVKAGMTALTAVNIIDKRQDQSVCGYVVGLVEQIDTAGIWSQLEASFDDWFDGIKGKLDGDTAGNLQNAIDAANKNIATNKTNIAANTANISSINTKVNGLTGDTVTIRDEDFNTLTTPGAYKVIYPSGSSAGLHRPSASIRGILEVAKAQDYIVQRYTEFGGYDYGRVFSRAYSSGASWSQWRELTS